MSSDYLKPWIAELVERPVGLDEFIRRTSAPVSDEEVEQTAELVRWFKRRYPTVKQRLAYARRKFLECTRPTPIVGPKQRQR